MVVLGSEVLDRYERFSLYNSPYPAHERGRAVDLYPAAAVGEPPGSGVRAPSPVGGEVLDTRTVAAPSRQYAADHDHLLLVDAGDRIARVLHVDPAVEPGERVAVGDDLGTLVRSGYFAPWVDDHVHLGFRERDADPYRATGSLPLSLGVDVEPLTWDGTGRVVEAGDTYAVLDSPAHSAPGDQWAGVAATTPGGTAVLDGGLPHYDGGGLLPVDGAVPDDDRPGPVELLGAQVGTVGERDVDWRSVRVLANGGSVTGLSLFAARDRGFGAKLVDRDAAFEVGESVSVEVRTSAASE